MIKKLMNKINNDDNYFYAYLAVSIVVGIGIVVLFTP